MKRILAALLALCLLISVLPANVFAAEIVASGTCGDNATWTLDDAGMLTISGTGPMSDYGNRSDVPWYNRRLAITAVAIEKGITSIGDMAFADCDSLANVSIPNSVTSIGNAAFNGCNSLTSVTIPDSVTSIGDGAFESCNSLTRVTIPDSVISIGRGAFAYCPRLTSTDFGNGVTEIGYGAFYDCDRLTRVTIPDSVTSIGEFAFNNCDSLTGIWVDDGNPNYGSDTFGVLFNKAKTQLIRAPGALEGSYLVPDSITQIVNNSFSNCHKLTSVSFPDSVTSIGESAFYNCTILAELNFSCNAPSIGWDAFSGVTATAFYPVDNNTWASGVMRGYGGTITWVPYTPENNDSDTPASAITISDGTFSYYSGITKANATYTFDYDENWFFDDTVGYNHDLAKMSMRMALAAARKGDSSIKELFTTLKMTTTEYHYPAPSSDTIGYAIGSKEITDESGEKVTLIAVAVRGGGYGAEWASNFKMGMSSQHQGFEEAAETVVKAVKSHISANGYSDNIKIWITGYSRAAATSNLAAHTLAADAYYGNIKGLDADGVMAYCFECPRGVRTDHPAYSYDHGQIYNIVNVLDVVPMVAPEAWDFSWYGTTYYLPFNGMSYGKYKTEFSRMQSEYKNILQQAGADEYVFGTGSGFGLPAEEMYTTSMMGQEKILRTFVNALAAGTGGQSTYAIGYQDEIRAVMSELNDDDISAGEVIAALAGVSAVATIPAVIPLLPVLLLAVDKIGYAHYPELCMAWLDSLSGDTRYDSAKTRYVVVNCPVNVAIYDSAGTLVAQIINDEVQEIEGSTIGAMIDENGQKVICLPLDEEFDVIVTATDEGAMSYQVEEYDLASGETTRVINYYDIAITEGDILNGTASTGVETDAQYSLTAPDGETLNPSNELTAEEIVEHDVTVSSEGNGTVTGGGLFVTGEFAMVTATADESESFLGWYVEDTLVSPETEYRFRVESDVQIVGKFTQTIPSVIRLKGKDRYLTAFAVANQLKEKLEVTRFETVVVAYGRNFPDALTGSYLAAVMKAPILLTEKNADSKVLAYIEENLIPGGKVYILGGTAAVTESFEIDAKAKGFDVERLKDKDRYGTNLAILREAEIRPDDEILIATGTNYADSLSASATGLPMLLVGGSLTEAQKAFLATTSGKFVIIGGTGAVSQKVEDQLNEIGTAVRVKGKTRYETSVVIAQRYFANPSSAVLAYAQDFPDGLCGGPLAYVVGAPLILTSGTNYASADSYIEGMTSGFVTGGTGRLTDEVVREIFDLPEGTEIPAR